MLTSAPAPIAKKRDVPRNIISSSQPIDSVTVTVTVSVTVKPPCAWTGTIVIPGAAGLVALGLVDGACVGCTDVEGVIWAGGAAGVWGGVEDCCET